MPGLEWRMFKVGHCRQIERLSCRTAPWRFCNFPALVGLITHPAEGHILFDTGYAPRFFETTARFPERAYRLATPATLPPHERLSEQLARQGIAVADIRAIVVSHFHADHIAGVGDFPRAAIVCARAGFDAIRSVGRIAGVRRGLIPSLLTTDVEARTRFVEELPTISLPADMAPFERGHDLFGDGRLVAISLPGHADGQLGLTFTGGDGRKVFLIADAAWSIDAVRHNTLPMRLADRLVHHTTDYPATLHRLHQLQTQNSDVLIVPSHCRQRQRELVA